MNGLSPDTLRQTRKIFLQCEQFRNDAYLSTIFIDRRIRPFRERLRTAASIEERVDSFIETFHELYTVGQENVLVLAIFALINVTESALSLYQELSELAALLAKELQSQHIPLTRSITRISERDWWEHFGFKTFPFDSLEVDYAQSVDDGTLKEYFIQPAEFERLLGNASRPESGVLAAPRGSGKTTCRLMIEYYCRNKLEPLGEHVLCVPHIHLQSVINLAKVAVQTDPIDVKLEYHVQEILWRAMPALTDMLATIPLIREKTRVLSDPMREDLSQVISRNRRYLLPSQVTFLQGCGIIFPKAINQLNRKLRKFDDVIEHLEQFARLIHQLGIAATYILVDNVDELEGISNEPASAFHNIRPLFTSLRLLDGIRFLALKFFVPEVILPRILSDSEIRRDRGLKCFITMQWTPELLTTFLRKRMDSLKSAQVRQGVVEGFATLCVPELRSQIEENLISQAQGNPRYLMTLCALMVEEHCKREIPESTDPYQLNRTDLEMALLRFKK